MLETGINILSWCGLAVFAATGGIVAAHKKMDIVGFAMLATVTGIGGGTIRDLLLGLTPVFWIRQPEYLLVCVAMGVVVFFSRRIRDAGFLIWFDAIGLALFCVTGAERALSAGAGPVAAVAMGMVTATFGGIIRDVLGGESPIIFSKEIYITAALFGALAYVGLIGLSVPQDIAFVSGFVACLALRGAAIYFDWSLPQHRG
jgi:uncharacterized membrane protein YeiH